MTYLTGVAWAVFTVMIAGISWAADDVASDFYALRDVNRTATAVRDVRLLSDAQLAKVEGHAWFPWADDHLRQAQVREIVFQYFVASVLADLFGKTHEGPIVRSTAGHNNTSSPVAFAQGNFLIQLNIAIGDNITQMNSAIQQNLLIIRHRVL